MINLAETAGTCFTSCPDHRPAHTVQMISTARLRLIREQTGVKWSFVCETGLDERFMRVQEVPNTADFTDRQ